MHAPQTIEIRIPGYLASGRTLQVSASPEPIQGRNGTVRVHAGLESMAPSELTGSLPILVLQQSEARERVLAAMDEFRRLFPAHVCYNRIVPVDEVVTLTLYYRQDEWLQRLMLTEAEIETLNQLWDELLFVAEEPLRFEVAFEQIREFATQDRPDLVTRWDPLKPGVVARADAFRQRLVDTEPIHVRSVVAFAQQAWRRPITEREKEAIRDFYQHLRADDLGHDVAIRLTLARILTSPDFLYRRETQPDGAEPSPVNSFELATRLSYFLWSSTPDNDLFSAAQSGQLPSEHVLKTHTRRMLQDPKTRRLAIQFATQWLHLRNFDENDDKNESLFPEFADLRDDMYEETVQFFEDMFRNDRSVLEILDADHAFLNETLAAHYGIPGVSGSHWRRVEQVQARGRGGVLGMAAFLASQSGASRTSPILRGNWIYETLLGQRLPRPPANVPTLPENVPSGLTARELIEHHSSQAQCAKCHAKIDPYGFALEQYDAIGRRRPATVDTSTTLDDGREIEGIEGLRQYLLMERRDTIVRQFCRKLLGFAIGRQIQLADERLLDEMQSRLEANDFRFGVAVETIVTSSPFRQIRGRDADTVDAQEAFR